MNTDWMTDNLALSMFFRILRHHNIYFNIKGLDIVRIKVGDLDAFFKLKPGKRTYFYLYNGKRRIKISIYDSLDTILAKLINFVNFDYAPLNTTKKLINLKIVYSNIKDQMLNLGIDNLKIKLILIIPGRMRIVFQNDVEIDINRDIGTKQSYATITYPVDVVITHEKISKLASYVKDYFDCMTTKFTMPKNLYKEFTHEGTTV